MSLPQGRLDFFRGYSRHPKSRQADLAQKSQNITIPTFWGLKRVTGLVHIPLGGVTCRWDYRKHNSLRTLWEISPPQMVKNAELGLLTGGKQETPGPLRKMKAKLRSSEGIEKKLACWLTETHKKKKEEYCGVFKH